MGPDLTHLLDSLGWAVLHSIWQGGVAFLAVIVWRLALRGRAPAVRHAGQFLALLGCLIAFLWTFATYLGLPQIGIEEGATSSIPTGGENPNILTGIIAPFDPSSIAAKSGLNFSRLTPVLACLWVFGFAVMSLRYAFAFGQVQQLRTLGVIEPDTKWTYRFATLVANCGVSKNVRLLISANVSGPMTLGLIKPVVLVPVGFLSGLPADQVEAVLLHELAHIRRYDYALNLMQTFVKTVLFFHPAIHIISRWADQDREQACDDLAVRQGHDPLALVRGLAALRLQGQPTLGLSATGDGENSPLMARLTRLAGQSPQRGRTEHVLMSVLSALLIGSIYLGSTSRANAHPVPPVEPKLPDTVITSKRSITPPPPQMPFPPTLNLDGAFDQNRFQRLIEQERKLQLQFSSELNQYEWQLESYIENSDLDEIEIESLVENFEDFEEEAEDLFEDRQEKIEERFEDYVEAKVEALNENLAAAAKRQSESQTRIAEAKKRKAEAFARAEASKAHAEAQAKAIQAATKARKHAEKAARKAASKAQANAQKYHYSSENTDAFRDAIMSELVADGLIKNENETVLLSHPGNVMSLNNKPMAVGTRGKYCSLLDRHGFGDTNIEITIEPDSLKILTDWKDGRHTTQVTHGTTKH